jgi:hypothetical protein
MTASPSCFYCLDRGCEICITPQGSLSTSIKEVINNDPEKLHKFSEENKSYREISRNTLCEIISEFIIDCLYEKTILTKNKERDS